ncbi:MAG: LysR family transcriptional regulator [Hyphomicrobium sp.]
MSIKPDALPFDLRALEIFLSVCDTGAMASAARALGLTQPAISQAIAELEARTGTVLFDRSVRPLGLTPAGGVMRQRAAALLSEARQIAPLLKEADQGKLSLIRVGLVDSLARALSLPIAEFLHTRAESVQVQSGFTAAHAGALLTRNLDLFVGADELSEVAGLQRFELVSEPYVLLLPVGVTPPVNAAGLRELASTVGFVRYSARSKTGIEIERHLRRLSIEIPSGYEFDTPFGVHGMVDAGHGFAITTPLCIAEAPLDDVRTCAAALPGPKLTRTLTLIARRHELGNLPRDLSRTCRDALEASALKDLRAVMPWLGADLVCSQ